MARASRNNQNNAAHRGVTPCPICRCARFRQWNPTRPNARHRLENVKTRQGCPACPDATARPWVFARTRAARPRRICPRSPMHAARGTTPPCHISIQPPTHQPCTAFCPTDQPRPTQPRRRAHSRRGRPATGVCGRTPGTCRNASGRQYPRACARVLAGPRGRIRRPDTQRTEHHIQWISRSVAARCRD